MKNKVFRNIIVLGALLAILVSLPFAQTVNVKQVTAEVNEMNPNYNKCKHWSEIYIDQLSKYNEAETVFRDKNLNSAMNAKDFQKLVKLTIDKEYNSLPDSMTREAVVYEFTRIWAEKTKNDLENIPIIKMLIYTDTGEIDAKYIHSITLAYMKNIAKGKGSSIFDPKTDVTYGELAALIINTDNAIKEELKPDDGQPIVKGKFNTSGSCEIKDDKVFINFELMSHYTQSTELMFGSGQQFEVTITDEKGKEVYKYSDGKFFTLAIVSKTIGPGEIIKWQDEWDMKNKDGEKLTSGKYKAEIRIMAEMNDEKIEDSQLTTIVDIDLMLKSDT